MLAVTATIRAEAVESVAEAGGGLHLSPTPEPALLVMLGLVLTFTAYQLRRLLGAPQQRQ